ncbi:putative LRR receptor-like serine/threonine-protein kinase [Canna indica]|uniref:non-specific serine/threonine protein kinase n=1 Tax=Canna indica TaxID=4628 RepID=A0AAQ3K0Y4_9LILI|nr:putative LRR receptor-like serine/threonine-protein kinase [Canna indica]
MSSERRKLLGTRWEAAGRSLCLLLAFLVQISAVLGLSEDGVLLLKFKYSILSDPLAVLQDWNYYDDTPCSWNGVVCMGFQDAAAVNLTPPAYSSGGGSAAGVQVPMVSRVISLVLPNSQLLGSVPAELGLVEHLRHLDLSGNMLNGTLPASIFNASELRALSLANNAISGELPEFNGGTSSSLQVLNLSDNALIGRLPANLSRMPNLTILSLANNYIFGELPGGGFQRLQFLDLSSNLVNGSLPPDLAGLRLRYLNLSYNRLSGMIPPELGARISANATVDLSYNNLTGVIPHSGAFAVEKPMAFAGNPSLCGRPLKNSCTIPSTISEPPNSTTAAPPLPKSPPAFAAIPKNPDGVTSVEGAQSSPRRGTLRPAIVIAITVGDLAGIAILFVVFLYVYHVKRKKKAEQQDRQQRHKQGGNGLPKEQTTTTPPATAASSESKGKGGLSCCLRKKKDGDGGDTEETSETSESSETEAEVEEAPPKGAKEGEDVKSHPQQKQQQGATLVMVDGETELEMENLLKASAYILGASQSSIVYKAVLSDGTALAVRRIGESSVLDKLKDFGAQVRSIAKFRHPNLLRLRGFYWGTDEKLLIHDYAPNGSLANISFSKKLGSSPLHLSWEARLRIARGVARGLAYLHEKKSLHGNLKPSNILLDSEMEPKIGDFGLDRVMIGAGTSTRQFGSKRSMQSSISLPDLSSVAGASPSAGGVGSSSLTSAFAPPPYQAPESLKNLKPNSKWDVYSFGMVLLELIAGRVFSEVELCHWNAGFVVEERNRLLRMADAAIRGEVEGKEEALLSCFKLGFACCAMAPQRRPSMKDALQVLDNIFSSYCSSSHPHP